MNKPVTKLEPEAEVASPVDPLALLRRPFPPNQISKLPKGNVMLDYVGHAATTDRLLDADPHWNWEPLAMTPEGLPALDREGGLWIKLTVCGLTRLGYGTAPGKKGGDAMKELIGDAIRNGAMRFGVALDLWHKGDLHAAETDTDSAPTAEEMATNLLKGCGSKEMLKDAWERNEKGWRGVMDEAAYLRLKGLCIHLAKQFAEPPPPADDFGIGDDEIPF
jgi:hypothetical protein